MCEFWNTYRHPLVIAIAFLILLIALSVFVWFRTKNGERKWLTWSTKGVPRMITNRPIASLAVCYGLICLCLYLEIWWEEISIDNSSTILMCITIIGFFGTIIGLILTYVQLKRTNNQFFGYYDFYRIADELLSQDNNRIIKFHFTTPIPGHIAFGEGDEFNSYLNKLKNYKGEIQMVIPDENTIIEMYEYYLGRKINDTFITDEMIQDKLTLPIGEDQKDLDVSRFVNSLRSYDPQIKKHKVIFQKYKLQDGDKEPEAIENLYLSDGKTAIYAVPLHFLNLQDYKKSEKKQGNDPVPSLVGFVTTDRSLVTTLDRNFATILERCEELGKTENYLEYDRIVNLLHKKRQLDLLDKMYSKYIKNPDYHWSEINDISDTAGSEAWCEKVLDLAQDNFDGMTSTNEIIHLLDLKATDKVLDVGSGFGGVSLAIAKSMKQMAESINCKNHGRVTGIEVQKDRYDFARNLSVQLHIEEYVNFECDYFPNTRMINGQYDKIVSVLAILHFIDKRTTLTKVVSLLVPGGKLVIDDYYTTSNSLSAEDQASLYNTISIPNLLTEDEYIGLLKESGIEKIVIIDKTDEWKDLCKQRVENLIKNRDAWVNKWGEERTKKHIEFCSGVSKLYEDGIVHGFRIVGTKKRR